MPMSTQIGSERVTDREFEHAIARTTYEHYPENAPKFYRGCTGKRPPVVVMGPNQNFGPLQLGAARDCGARVMGIYTVGDETHIHLMWTDR